MQVWENFDAGLLSHDNLFGNQIIPKDFCNYLGLYTDELYDSPTILFTLSESRIIFPVRCQSETFVSNIYFIVLSFIWSFMSSYCLEVYVWAAQRNIKFFWKLNSNCYVLFLIKKKLKAYLLLRLSAKYTLTVLTHASTYEFQRTQHGLNCRTVTKKKSIENAIRVCYSWLERLISYPVTSPLSAWIKRTPTLKVSALSMMLSELK